MESPSNCQKTSESNQSGHRRSHPLHTEYRDWCPHCVEGKGISSQHKHKNKIVEEPLGTTVSMDYLFSAPEEEDEAMDAILLGYDANRKSIWTMSVDKKEQYRPQ